ncbi:nucleoside hydrolase [Edwardsiella tarda]
MIDFNGKQKERDDMKKVILDVDTGSDDAIAIMTAALSDKLEVLGICTVNGNRCIENTTENTLRVVQYINAKIPVYKGCALPLVVSLTNGRRESIPFKGQEDKREDVHGDFLPLPTATIKAEKEDAVTYLIKSIMESDGDISIIAVGPLTNIAVAIRTQPEITRKIDTLYIMGGGWHEANITPSAEFNFWIDPEAAKIVVDSGCKIIMVPLDATHAGSISINDARFLANQKYPAAKLAATLIEKRLSGYNNWQPMTDKTTVPIHDALAVCAAIDEKVLADVRYINVDIDINGGVCDGQSVCDVENKDKHKKPNVYVALSANKEYFSEILKKTLLMRL